MGPGIIISRIFPFSILTPFYSGFSSDRKPQKFMYPSAKGGNIFCTRICWDLDICVFMLLPLFILKCIILQQGRCICAFLTTFSATLPRNTLLFFFPFGAITIVCTLRLFATLRIVSAGLPSLIFLDFYPHLFFHLRHFVRTFSPNLSIQPVRVWKDIHYIESRHRMLYDCVIFKAAISAFFRGFGTICCKKNSTFVMYYF